VSPPVEPPNFCQPSADRARYDGLRVSAGKHVSRNAPTIASGRFQRGASPLAWVLNTGSPCGQRFDGLRDGAAGVNSV
jgi:hypothetical protein